MGFYPDVQPGQAYRPSAALENDVRHLLNRLNGFSVPGGMLMPERNLKIYNATENNTLLAGTVVAPAESGDIIDGAIPVRQYRQGDKLFGVVIEDMEVDAFGSCTIAGPVEVAISGTGATAAIAEDGKSFVAGTGDITVLYISGDRGVVLLGASSGTAEYNGYFKLIATLAGPTAGDETTTTKIDVKIVDGANATGNSMCCVNNTKYFVPPYSTQIELDYAIAEVDMVEYFSLQYTPENYTVSIVKHDDRHFPINSTLIGRVFIRNGTVSAVQDSYGVAQIMWFALCDDGSESEGTAE